MAQALVESFKGDVQSGNCEGAKSKLSALKLQLLRTDSDDTANRVLTRTALEWGCLLAVRMNETEAFQRHMSQLKDYYTDFSASLPPSDLQNAMLGLNLLHLLMEDRLAEFHSELELIPRQSREHECIAFPIRIEQFLMVGSYDKVLAMRSNVPQEYFSFLMTPLVDTVRAAIAQCCERAYESLSLSSAQQMMKFESESEFVEFVEDEHPEWSISDGKVVFQVQEEKAKSDEIPSMKLISDSLGYASELERIV